MAPVKKSKSVRVITSASDSSPSKDEKSKQKKRKLSDMLGPQWSKHEIERFYEAYRKHGQDWKKVATVVRSRSIDMVEALYNMNRAYLSLPEGTASVAGLIAMMTDHYNVLEGSGSEKEIKGPEVMARKIQKNTKAKGLLDSFRDDSKLQSTGSYDGCLSLLKNRGDGIQLNFPVRKRTPRVPVSCLDIHPNKKSRVSGKIANDTGVPYGDLRPKEAWCNPNSPHGSQTMYRKNECTRTSQVSAREEMSRSPVLKVRTGGFAADRDFKECSLGYNEAKTENWARDRVDIGKSALAEYKKGKKGKKGKKEEVQHSETTLFDNIREAYKYADKGPRRIGSDGKSADICRSTSEGQSRGKKLTFEDELAACDALQTLAEMSSMMPFIAAEPAEDAGDSVLVRETVVNSVACSNIALSDEKASVELKKKRKSQALKVPKAEFPNDFSKKPTEDESVADEDVKSGNSSGQISVVSKNCKSLVRSPDVSSSNDPHTGEAEVAVSSAHVHHASQVVNPTGRKRRRKRDRTFLLKDKNYTPSCSSDSLSVPHERLQDVKGKLLHCLSWHEVRRWCVYEWFYSAIDYPWFAKREFVEYLDHVGLGHIPRLTRFELGVIRSSLGKPRRFSERFLQEERKKLNQYRESVRTQYANLRAGLGEGLPTDLACPLYVGQKVVAIHPKTRECHNGSVLTVDRDNCMVQFHHPDLGVELVMDIDCMPLNLLENMPEDLKRQNMLFDYRCVQVPKINGANFSALEEYNKSVNHHIRVPSFSPSVAADMKAKPACLSAYAKVVGSGSFQIPSATQSKSYNMAQLHLQEGHLRFIPGLTGGLDQKVFGQSCSESLPSWPHPTTESVGLNGNMPSLNNSGISCQETASNVAEIVEVSKDKAQKMVDTATKAISSIEEGEDAFGRIRKALDASGKSERVTNCRASMIPSSNAVRGSLPHQNPLTSCASEAPLSCDAFTEQPTDHSVSNDLQIPSDLITSCVATWLMIQTCTERQYPPAEVAQILDDAVTGLHPCCPQNLSIYREIQMCMGRIKTQILALVPT
ncbi:protein ALWAYS EARLY 2-like isoform X2 [Chenopodium quinoa]|uniref:protein ALWAYS EARLY 2-like isoform X2 n=1 Tax=Chenopodium quinoa TaxID=63459 RepID=UPI000B78A02D|nr:protein ALWAYS EARLY 2-like isoform X2 [Chenopodium quinoa]